MSEPYPQASVNKNEIVVHRLISNSFVFLRTLGMRSAPEVLMLEIYREFFYKKVPADNFRGINPDEEDKNGEPIYPKHVQAVLHAVRGRKRKAGKKHEGHYFLPAYPSLAQNAWFRQREAPIISSFLLEGHVANYIWSHEKSDEESNNDWKEFVEKFYKALIGNRSTSYPDHDATDKDILSAALKGYSAVNMLPEDEIKEKIKSKSSSNNDFLIDLSEVDELSKVIFEDLMELLDLERDIPRMQWLELFITFLRFSIPMWAMAQMKITSLLHCWLVEAIDMGKVAEKGEISDKIARRNHGILQPTVTPTVDIYDLIETYIKKRIEINYTLYDLEKILGDKIENKENLKIQDQPPSGVGLSISELLDLAKKAAPELKKSDHYLEEEVNNYKDLLSRKAEKFSSWLRPRSLGVGANIQEFFNVLYHDTNADQLGGHLLEIDRIGGSINGFRVFPGQLLLKTVTILAGRKKHKIHGGGGALVLEDVEKHFSKYGIDFGKAKEARPALIELLKSMGLLSGSPDAGASVAVICPYIK